MSAKKTALNLLFAAALISAPVFTLHAAVNLNGNVEARNQSGVHDGDVYRNYLKADLELGENFSSTVVKVILRAEDDSLRPEDTGSNYLRDDGTGPQRIYLREAWLSHDIYFESVIDSINFKMGRIIYTWGNSDEEKPVDIINPQDYSNLYFTPIQERKIGVFSASMSVFFNENFFIEGVAVPESGSSEIASDVFITRQAGEVMGNPLYDLQEPETPDKNNKQNSYAGRIGITIFDIDMHGNYFYGYDHLPVNKLEFTGAPPIKVTPGYKKIQMFGFDFQRALFMGVTIRGEGAYFDRGKYFYYSSESASGNLLLSPMGEDLSSGGSGSTEKSFAHYVIGFDDQDFIFDDLYLNLQFSQKIIMDYEDTLADDRYVNHMLWTVKFFMSNRRYCISTKGAYNIKDESVYANGEFLVKLADNFDFMIGVWFLEGDEETDIGQFDSNDMVYVAGKLTF